jgi:hypothetical protein
VKNFNPGINGENGMPGGKKTTDILIGAYSIIVLGYFTALCWKDLL